MDKYMCSKSIVQYTIDGIENSLSTLNPFAPNFKLQEYSNFSYISEYCTLLVAQCPARLGLSANCWLLHVEGVIRLVIRRGHDGRHRRADDDFALQRLHDGQGGWREPRASTAPCGPTRGARGVGAHRASERGASEEERRTTEQQENVWDFFDDSAAKLVVLN